MVPVSMGEGNTPLIESARIGPSMGLSRLFFKLENCNPSGSYKDRFVAAEMSCILASGARACLATSSGNTGSSLAAYSARTGLTCAIVVNESVPQGKLQQMQAHGARIFRVKDFIVSPEVTENVYRQLSRLSEAPHGLPLVVSAYRYCPGGMTAVESIASELCQQCGETIEHVFVPVGGGGLFTAICRGFERQAGSRPRIHAVQPQGCSTVVAAFERGDDHIRPVKGTTRISGLGVPFDIDASLALEHLRRCGGRGVAVSDEQVFEAQRTLFNLEGIYCEPAGATSLAGLFSMLAEGVVDRDKTMVCLVTGHGFKDPDSIKRATSKNMAVLVEDSQIYAKLLEATRVCVSQ